MKLSSGIDIKVQAEIYRLGLFIGFFQVKNVIEWADQLIEKLDQPPYEILEISLSSHATRAIMCSKLTDVKEECDEAIPIQGILSLLHNELFQTSDVTEICTYMYRLVGHIPESCEDMERSIINLTDGWKMAVEGYYGDIEEVRVEIYEFLKEFESN
ncbi:hypothetical protein ABE65_012210 [Fictibacillus phosphorivorans]|uniref:Uncharacterized protein n=1 Tax=Fictibacillus phosphorivorans TaxID=1221500 RepID=A0A161J727_9BACL|nr:hypothetical protein [Fictibacillus phosphorivorans]ANC77519.1 hypothetical protein ABE65_012210 [Fictibacillus phosphorivorans]